jgi:chaperonin GroEL (HSP60 family)
MNPMDVRKGIISAVEAIVESLKAQSIPIKGKD